MKPGDPVNLERAFVSEQPFGGHLVAGHVDGTGKIVSKQQDENAIWLTVGLPRNPSLYCRKGSVAIDGVSLTIAYVDEQIFKVSVIPHTQEETTLVKKEDRRCGEFRKRYDCQICRETDGTGENRRGLTLFPGGQWLLSRLE